MSRIHCCMIIVRAKADCGVSCFWHNSTALKAEEILQGRQDPHCIDSMKRIEDKHSVGPYRCLARHHFNTG